MDEMEKNTKRWKIPSEKDFREIDNGDSIQLANPDESRLVYLSILSASDSDGFPATLPQQSETPLAFVQEGNVYNLRGTKIRDNEVLVVVITIKDRNDEAWARHFFDDIDYR